MMLNTFSCGHLPAIHLFDEKFSSVSYPFLMGCLLFLLIFRVLYIAPGYKSYIRYFCLVLSFHPFSHVVNVHLNEVQFFSFMALLLVLYLRMSCLIQGVLEDLKFGAYIQDCDPF